MLQQLKTRLQLHWMWSKLEKNVDCSVFAYVFDKWWHDVDSKCDDDDDDVAVTLKYTRWINW